MDADYRGMRKHKQMEKQEKNRDTSAREHASCFAPDAAYKQLYWRTAKCRASYNECHSFAKLLL
uniref:Uncharacterized protein n=1 Tax=Oryza punctata TaxID=4537 RepID=A0A0E0LWT4_ORYPU